MKNKRVFKILLITVISLLVIVFAVYSYLNHASSKTYTLEKCGISIVVKNDKTVNVSHWITIGSSPEEGVPGAEVFISCKDRGEWEKDVIENPYITESVTSYVLGIQAGKVKEVDKGEYKIFDNETLSNMTELYSTRNKGYRIGSEDVAFSNDEWIYLVSSLNPEELKTSKNYLISVN